MGYSTVRRIMREGLTDPRNLDGIALWNSTRDVTDLTTYTGIKLWADKSGNSSTNVLCLNGVAGNYASAPDSAPLSITGDITLIAQAMLTDWTPGTAMCLIGKEAGDPQRSYWMEIDTGGTISISWTTTGSIASVLTMTSTVAITVTDLASKWVQATLDVDNGSGSRVAKFYVSDDGVTWVQLGTTVTTAGATSIADTTAVLSVGARGSGGGQRMVTGNIMRARILNGYDGAGSVVFDANFATAAKLATSFTESSSNAATVTINTSGATGARISGARDYAQMTGSLQGSLSNGYLTTDGTDDYMATPRFPLPTVHTRVMALRQTTWSSGDYLCDGGAANTSAIIQTTSTPQINISAGSSVAANTTLPVNTNAVVTTVINGASSLLRVGLGSPTAGNAGAGVPNGQTLGASATPGNYGNAGFAELITYGRALDDCDQAKAIRAVSMRAKVFTV